MRRTITISIRVFLLVLVIVLATITISNHGRLPDSFTFHSKKTLFSKEADNAFVSSFASNVMLNSGITIERAMPLNPEQANYVTFAVFNHTEEPIQFPDQGFGITIFRYDDTNQRWERLQLPNVPYHEPKILSPKLETMGFKDDNMWDLLEDDTTSFGEKRLRLYVSGVGQTTNKVYGAYLDVPINLEP